MEILLRLKSDMIAAMKAKDIETRNLLKVVIGDITTKMKGEDGEEFTEDDAMNIIVKMKKNAVTMKAPSEVKILSKYLPSVMDSDELKETIQAYVTEQGYTTMRDMGKVMGYLRGNFENKYDGKEASVIVKEILG